MPSKSSELASLRARFANPRPSSRPTPLYFWSGGDLDIDRMIWHLDLLKDKGVGGTIICYAHKPDGSIDHGSPAPFSDEWWVLLKKFVQASSDRGLSVGICDYQVIGTVLLNAAEYTTGLHSGNLKNTFEFVVGPGEFLRPRSSSKILSRRAVSKDGSIVLDAAKEDDDSVIWSLPEGEWILSTAAIEPGQIYLFESKFDPLHPNSGESVNKLFFDKFKSELGEHLGTTFTIFFQDELELGLTTPMWNSLVGESLIARSLEPEDVIHLLWHGQSDQAMQVRGLYRDIVVRLLQEHFFKPIFNWHERNSTSLVMDQLSRGDLALGHEHYSDFMETMAWYQGPGNDDPDLTADRNIAAFRTSSSIAHLNGRPYVSNEAFHSSGWGVTPNDVIAGLNTDFAAGANQVILHALDYTLEAGWWEWASPDFHFRQPWWEHSEPMWTYLTRISEMLQSGQSACEIAVLDPTPELDFYADSNAPSFASKMMEHLSRSALGVDLVPQAYLADSHLSSNSQTTWLSVRKAQYSAVVVPSLKIIRSTALDALQSFVNAGGVVINLGAFPIRSDSRILNSVDFMGWHQVSNNGDLIAELRTRIEVDFEIDQSVGELLQSHRRIDGADLYFVANPSKITVTQICSIRGDSPLQQWDAWSGETKPMFSELETKGDGACRRIIKLTLEPGESILILQSDDFQEVPILTTATITEQIDLSSDWNIELKSILDNRYFDYSDENPELPVASYYVDLGETPQGPWIQGLVDHGVRFLVSGPIQASSADAYEEALFNEIESGQRPQSGTWCGYAVSLATGIPQDAYLQDRMTGPHGLKGAPPEFLDPAAVFKDPSTDDYYYFWSTIESAGGSSLLRSCGRAEHQIWINGKSIKTSSEIAAVHFPPWNLRDMSSEIFETAVDLKNGTNHVLVRVKISDAQPSRIGLAIGGELSASPSKSRMIWWQGERPALEFAVPDLLKTRWLKCKIPPGAKTAIIKTYVQVHCPNGESVSKTIDGYSISLKSDISELLLELTSSQNVNQSLDASALLGPIVWICQKARISLSAWEDLGLRDFSGLAIYEKMHDFGEEVPAFVELEISGIEGSLRVLVNDRLAGYALGPKISIPLDGLLVTGVNKFAVESANTLVNLFSRLPSPYSTMQKPSGGFTKATLKLGIKN